ncbi:MAG: hypothetical protein AVDCRST_MAG35-467, partial [uncultured Quadrisphaera sp.]
MSHRPGVLLAGAALAAAALAGCTAQPATAPGAGAPAAGARPVVPAAEVVVAPEGFAVALETTREPRDDGLVDWRAD